MSLFSENHEPDEEEDIWSGSDADSYPDEYDEDEDELEEEATGDYISEDEQPDTEYKDDNDDR